MTRIRQLVVASREMEKAADDLSAVLDTGVCHRDPNLTEFGAANVLLPVGDTFIEFLQPTRADAPVGRFLERASRDRGYMVVVQVDDLAAAQQRVEAAGVRIIHRTKRATMQSMHLHPKDIGGAIVSIAVAAPPDSWEIAGEWEEFPRSKLADRLTGVEIGAADPRKIADTWARVLGATAAPEGDGFVVRLDGGSFVRFVPVDAGAEGITGLDLSARDAAEIVSRAERRALPASGKSFDLAGVTFRLVPA